MKKEKWVDKVRSFKDLTTHKYYPEKTELTSDNWENIILEHNYVEIYFDGLNKYYLNQEKLDQFELPVTPKNYFDNYISYNEYCVLKKLKENML